METSTEEQERAARALGAASLEAKSPTAGKSPTSTAPRSVGRPKKSEEAKAADAAAKEQAKAAARAEREREKEAARAEKEREIEAARVAREREKEAARQDKAAEKEREKEEARLAREKEKEDRIAAKIADEAARDAAMAAAVSKAIAKDGCFQEGFDFFAETTAESVGPENLRAERVLPAFVGQPRFDEFFFRLAAARPHLRSWLLVDLLLDSQLSPEAFKHAVYFCTAGGPFRGTTESDVSCKCIMASRLAAQCGNANREDLEEIMENLVTSVASVPRQVKAPRWSEPVLWPLPADFAVVASEAGEWDAWDGATRESEGVGVAEQAWLACVRRIECLVKLIVCLDKNGGRFKLAGANCNIGKKPKSDNFAMCHSSIIAGLTREAGGKKESTRVQLWFGTKLIHDLNRTVNLPSKCNSVDTCMERTCGMREELQRVVNHVAGSVLVSEWAHKSPLELWHVMVERLHVVARDLSLPDSKKASELTAEQRVYAAIQARACQVVLDKHEQFVRDCLARDGIVSPGNASPSELAAWRAAMLLQAKK